MVYRDLNASEEAIEVEVNQEFEKLLSNYNFSSPDLPLKRKKSSKKSSRKTETLQNQIRQSDFTGTEWEGCNDGIPIAFSVAKHYSNKYGSSYYDDLLSEMLLRLPRISRSYDPLKSTQNYYYRRCLCSVARKVYLKRNPPIRKLSTVSLESVHGDTLAFMTNEEDKWDFDTYLSRLTKDEQWFIAAYFQYSGKVEELLAAWNAVRKPISRSSMYRIINSAAMKLKEMMNDSEE